MLLNSDQHELQHFERLFEKMDISQPKIQQATPSFPPLQPISKQDTQSIKVLVIEDDSIARRVAKLMLTRANFEVDDVENAELGFWQVIHNHYDLILTDIGLPGMNGNQFTMMVRAWEKATHHQDIPIVGLTAHGKNQQTGKEAGMNMLFSKPLNEQKIQAINSCFFTTDKPLKESILSEIKPPGYSYPLLAEKEGLEATGGDINFLKELVAMLIDQILSEELQLLIEAHNEDNWKKIQAIAHKLKGSTLYCGVKRLRYACQYIERYRLAGHSKLLEPLYSQLLAVMKDTIDYLKKWLAQKNA